MTILIRAAARSDACLLARLNDSVQQIHAKWEPEIFKSVTDDKEVAAFFAAKVCTPRNDVRIASGSDGPTGYIWFEEQDRSETPLKLARRVIYIHHLSVQADARRQGIGTALLNHVEEEASARGIVHIALDTWTANASALSFFSARGYNPFNVSVRRQLA